jgi:CRISPR/Cas system CSM-associated protein Csm2 small subunit
MEIDNTGNFNELYNLIDGMESILNSNEYEYIRAERPGITNQHSPQGNNSRAITTRLACLEKKLSSIEPNKTSHEINLLKDFINHNKNKILEAPGIVNKLTTSLNLVNSIIDNAYMEIDNTSNFNELYNLIDKMKDILNEKVLMQFGSLTITDRQVHNEVQRFLRRMFD